MIGERVPRGNRISYREKAQSKLHLATKVDGILSRAMPSPEKDSAVTFRTGEAARQKFALLTTVMAELLKLINVHCEVRAPPRPNCWRACRRRSRCMRFLPNLPYCCGQCCPPAPSCGCPPRSLSACPRAGRRTESALADALCGSPHHRRGAWGWVDRGQVTAEMTRKTWTSQTALFDELVGNLDRAVELQHKVRRKADKEMNDREKLQEQTKRTVGSLYEKLQMMESEFQEQTTELEVLKKKYAPLPLP